MITCLFLPTSMGTDILKPSRCYVLRECKLMLNTVDMLLHGVQLCSFWCAIGQILSYGKTASHILRLKSSILVKTRSAEKEVIHPCKSGPASPWTWAWRNPPFAPNSPYRRSTKSSKSISNVSTFSSKAFMMLWGFNSSFPSDFIVL